MLRIVFSVLASILICSCSTSVMKKRYSSGYTFFGHKNKKEHEIRTTKNSEKKISAQEIIITKELVVKEELKKKESFLCIVNKEGKQAFRSLVKEKQKPSAY